MQPLSWRSDPYGFKLATRLGIEEKERTNAYARRSRAWEYHIAGWCPPAGQIDDALADGERAPLPLSSREQRSASSEAVLSHITPLNPSGRSGTPVHLARSYFSALAAATTAGRCRVLFCVSSGCLLYVLIGLGFSLS